MPALFGEALKYHFVPVDDLPSENILQYFAGAVGFIEAALSSPTPSVVLVHCVQGPSVTHLVAPFHLVTHRTIQILFCCHRPPDGRARTHGRPGLRVRQVLVLCW